MVPLVDVYIAIQHSGDCKQCLLGEEPVIYACMGNLPVCAIHDKHQHTQHVTRASTILPATSAM